MHCCETLIQCREGWSPAQIGSWQWALTMYCSSQVPCVCRQRHCQIVLPAAGQTLHPALSAEGVSHSCPERGSAKRNSSRCLATVEENRWVCEAHRRLWKECEERAAGSDQKLFLYEEHRWVLRCGYYCTLRMTRWIAENTYPFQVPFAVKGGSAHWALLLGPEEDRIREVRNSSGQ